MSAPASFVHECRYGAHRLDDGSVRFRLWAPDATGVELVLRGEHLPMEARPDGTFERVAEAGAGDDYRYRIDGDTEVPDPAARAQRDDINGPSVVVDPAAFRWHHGNWHGRAWQEAVICEVHVGTAGGFDRLREQLPHYRDAGYTAIELMPVAEFPGGRNWGYDGVLPYAVECSYGSPESLKALVDAAHGLGLMMMLDVVYNHFGPDGNWLGRYASDFFRRDIKTPWGEAIDFRQEPVKRYFIDNALMWLNEYRFDGLRFDAVHAIEPESFLDELSAAIRSATDGDRHVHLVLENEHNSAHLLERAFDAQWDDDFHNSLHALLTGESEGYYADFATKPAANLARVLSEGFLFQGQPDRRGATRGEPSAHLPPHAFVAFAQNHDQIGNRPMGERLITLIDSDLMRAATALVALTPMVPLFFMGDEWGCRTPFLFFTSHHGELADLVREGRRAEFAHFGGFADPARRAMIPDPNAPETFEASIPRRDDDPATADWSAWFSALLGLRQKRLVPHLQGRRALDCIVLDPPPDENVPDEPAGKGRGAFLTRWLLGNGSTLELCLNLGPAAVPAPSLPPAELLFAWPANAADEVAAGTLPAASLIARLHDKAG